jgi:hypothetical protein
MIERLEMKERRALITITAKPRSLDRQRGTCPRKKKEPSQDSSLTLGMKEQEDRPARICHSEERKSDEESH